MTKPTKQQAYDIALLEAEKARDEAFRPEQIAYEKAARAWRAAREAGQANFDRETGKQAWREAREAGSKRDNARAEADAVYKEAEKALGGEA